MQPRSSVHSLYLPAQSQINWTALTFVLDRVDPRLRDETRKARPRGPTTHDISKSSAAAIFIDAAARWFLHTKF
ncbi:hypothetical protein Hamer_G015006 [Homarus americanus]|uniref:Uncharacterized protein n=1 Tax=Homarus americanus TaxID=6706 RepID=A0A8J5MKE0_HOMAM|nr:hypothetical protein Hamer_G015006 [Homarus americanus]